MYVNLSEVIYGNGEIDFRMPDAVGNLFETRQRTDRTYGKGGKLLTNKGTTYEYDAEGNLIRKVEKGNKVWQYHWNEAGMLQSVVRPDETTVSFGYDALGRRVWKKYKATLTKWLWNGNVPFHEWKEFDARETTAEDVITWIFEQNRFVPAGKLKGNKSYSIIADHLGTPNKVYSDAGALIWDAELDGYGKLRIEKGEQGTCPFRYQGQYEDAETGLYYNRFRYYSAEEGIYISQDPIRLRGGVSFYSYVKDTNSWIDSLGLSCGDPDWSRTRHDGDTTREHVELHNVDDLTKPKHGVFAGDGYSQTNEAWKQRGTPTPQANGNDKYVIPSPEAGLEGGYNGSGDILNNTTIITEGGTDKIVTSFPSR